MAVTEDVRTEVRAWLDDNWDPDLTVADWWQRLADSGWAMPSWPEEHSGRGLARPEANAVGVEIGEAGALGPPGGLGHDAGRPRRSSPTAPTSRSSASCPRSPTARRPGASSSASPAPAPTSPASSARPSRTATSGSSTARRCGPPAASTPTSACSSPAPTPTPPSTRASATSASRCTSPASTSGRCVEMTGRALFNEVFLDDARVADDRPHRRARQRLGGGQHHAHERAGQPRRRRRLVRHVAGAARAPSPATSSAGRVTSWPRAAAAAPPRSWPGAAPSCCRTSWPSWARTTTR